MPFVVPRQDGHGYEMNSHYNEDRYEWMNIGWANGSPYNRIYNSDDFIDFLPTNLREAVLQLNWCFYNFGLLLDTFEYYQVRADGTPTTRSATRISQAWAGREHTRIVAQCDELVGKFDNDVMNREHNSLATALDQVRTILMEVPNCNDRGNYMEAFLGCTVQIAADGIFAPMFRFSAYLKDVDGFHANDVAVCLKAIACKIWRILYMRFGRQRDGIDPYAFRYGEQLTHNTIDEEFAAIYPAQRVPKGGFTEDTSLNNLSLWIKMDGHDTCNPERMPAEWSDHSIKIFDILGKVHSKFNPSWEKRQSLGLHNGKAYRTPTDEPTTGHEHKYAFPTEYFDIPNNDVPYNSTLNVKALKCSTCTLKSPRLVEPGQITGSSKMNHSEPLKWCAYYAVAGWNTSVRARTIIQPVTKLNSRSTNRRVVPKFCLQSVTTFRCSLHMVKPFLLPCKNSS